MFKLLLYSEGLGAQIGIRLRAFGFIRNYALPGTFTRFNIHQIKLFIWSDVFIPRFHLFIEINMTLFIELPVHCRDTCELNSADCVAKPRCLEVEDEELSDGHSSKLKVATEDSVVESDRDDSFLSDPDLISVRFPPSPSCSQFSVFISSRHVRSVASSFESPFRANLI